MKLRWKKLLAAPFIFLAAIVVLLEEQEHYRQGRAFLTQLLYQRRSFWQRR